MPTSEPPIAARSSRERGFTAEMTPTGIPIASQIRTAPIVSESVAGSREKICDRTETLFWYE